MTAPTLEPGARTPLAGRLCSLQAAAGAQDPIASAAHTETLLFVEIPLPWGESYYEANPFGSMSQRIRAIQLERYNRRQQAGLPLAGPLGGRNVYGIAPDHEWSRPGFRRVLAVSRPPGPFASYTLAEYFFEDGDDDMPVAMARNVIEGIGSVDEFASFRSPGEPAPQYFVCTHGQVDLCCARFGIPIYNALRADPSVRVWRTSHFGGHRFAPTLKEFPLGYMWGFLDEHATRQIVEREGSVEAVAHNMRGWSGVEPVVQPLDREAFIEHGWRWLDYRREGHILEADADAGMWRVRLDFVSPNGVPGAYEGTVVVRRKLEDIGCGSQFGSRSYLIPEYGIASLHRR